MYAVMPVKVPKPAGRPDNVCFCCSRFHKKQLWGGREADPCTITRPPHNCILRRGCRQQASLYRARRFAVPVPGYYFEVESGGSAFQMFAWMRQRPFSVFHTLMYLPRSVTPPPYLRR